MNEHEAALGSERTTRTFPLTARTSGERASYEVETVKGSEVSTDFGSVDLYLVITSSAAFEGTSG